MIRNRQKVLGLGGIHQNLMMKWELRAAEAMEQDRFKPE